MTVALAGAGQYRMEAARQPQAAPSATVGRTASPPPAHALATRRLLDQYCVTCHDTRRRTAGLALDAVDVAQLGEHAEVWEKVVLKLRAGSMPPAGMPRPDAGAAHAVSEWLESSLDRAAAARPDPGRTPIRRLTRTEYVHAIRDLFALEIDGPALLPADNSDRGFDSMARGLSLSPLLLDRYMAAARRIGRLAVGDHTMSPAFAAKTYDPPNKLFQAGRMGEDLPFGSRGGVAVRHSFPLDGEYSARIRLQRTTYDYIRGLSEPQQLEVRLDGRRIALFAVGGEDKGTPAPVSFAGDITATTSTAWEEYLHSGDAGLAVRFAAEAGPHTVAVSFLRRRSEPEGALQPPLSGFSLGINETLTSPSGIPEAAVDSVDISGPYSAAPAAATPSRRKIFVCQPRNLAEEEPCARRILSTVSRRAYRRPTDASDVDTLLGFYAIGRRDGRFETGIQLALERILVDPDFLFHVEPEPVGVAPGAAHRVSGVALASRLSFFLWSSIPDEELLDAAVRGTLHEPAVIDRQVRRMLADPRSKALVDNFADQWLSLRDIRRAAPDPELFPDFDENLREAFAREAELFIDSQVRGDQSVLGLLTANYTFLNERLARHYGIPNVHGTQFRRVTVGGDDRRGGLLGLGGLLMVTSYGDRTSPVIRGRWLLENVLGAPPAPPPDNVPSLKDTGDDGRLLSMRQRMERHRANPVCASCHARMDPLGFALENFDAIGRWRATDEAGAPVDASGAVPDGSRFDGVAGLKGFLLARRGEFVRTVAENLLTYALGREVAFYDRPALRAITREAAQHGHRWSSIILSITKSPPFQMRRSQS